MATTSTPSKTAAEATISSVLARYPKSFAEEAGVRVLDTPSGLFRLLVVSLLMSARIRATVAVSGSAALFARRWTTPRAMARSTWSERARVLNAAGYARYDESTATSLGATADLLIEKYHGDLRRLREDAHGDLAALRQLLREFRGIGDVGVDIFLREVQGTWTEVSPFADRRVLQAAHRLGLPGNAAALRELAGRRFVALVNALIRVELDDAYDEILTAMAST